MGLLDQVLGNVLGGRSGGLGGGIGGQSGGGGMSPIMMAVLGLLAQRAMGGRGSSGGGLGDLLGGGGLGGVLGGGSGGLLGGSGGGLNGGMLAGGLGGLLDSFNRSGHGDIANSWVGTGDNQPIAPNQLADALGPDTVNELSQHTGMPQQDLLSELSHVLPGVVDQLTPQGRLPQEHELDRY
ncbi:DUF937 domain-containing protein [Microvirga sp. BT688]|uniref:YidB family protein n=1 Tax=Microvirga sp. TaxID=1873136 RepID=UPI001688F8FD|nr:YidB family protein [Microvirga sp.]MBD2748698.1 DUF937 domain-containing protein [Microvirga sp.]